ncbi:nicotinamide mononucleotide deamidase-related protein [Sulfuracidifex tepidarius]|uniref:MoaB/Mog domain-containing protein n=1 Tax=Sulfuracidifex tepidarius TaxID=1294262 RepID=A0A510E4G0_9CREN|nr:nicotinamide mononucleotide deamidase-related protein [Sulfuracidifex tepidarius]BBG27401.1 hypothetical protein IC007_1950 [Sulfuracidifex tepidarius]
METKAEIISIGNEVVSGRTVNTNASHIAWRLTSMGFFVKRIVSVRDEEDEIKDALLDSIRRGASLIVTTGGLGPTYDDKTLESIAKALQLDLELNEDALKMIEAKYRSKGIPLTEDRRKMALLPKGSIPIENNEGIAPGVIIDYKDSQILCTPGVPREMEGILETFLKGYLKSRPETSYYEESFVVSGIGESSISPLIKELVKKYNLYIKSHPKGKELQDPELEIQIAGNGQLDEIRRRVKECREEMEKAILKNNLSKKY